jgi:O-antigen ligase
MQRNSKWVKGIPQYFLYLIVFLLIISMFVNDVEWSQGLTGIYQRNTGILFWLSIGILFAYSSTGLIDPKEFIWISLPILLSFTIVYGLLQYFDIDPYPWSNPFDAVQLTLGNPNFAGALIGLLVVVPLGLFVTRKEIIWKIFSVTTLAVLILLALGTKSLQSIVVMMISICVFFLIQYAKSKKLNAKLFRTLSSLAGLFILLTVLLLIFTNLNFLSNIKERFFFQGSVTQRLDYWRSGLQIFTDYPLIGVGPDQFQRFAALYRTKEQVLREGAFVIPDKAHSVPIDLLATGGIMAGLLWIFFVGYIFKKLLCLSRMELPAKTRLQLAIVGAIWSGYIFQALISPDHLILATLGYICAGFIIVLENPTTKKIVKKSKLDFLFQDPIYGRTALISAFSIAVVVWSQAISADISAKHILSNEKITRDSVLAAVNQWPTPKTTELIAIAVAKSDSKCDLVDDIANRLIEVDKRSAQGWYFKAICFNLDRRFDEALMASENSLKFDPMNPTYLVAKAKLGIAAGNKSEATEALDSIKSNYPNNSEIRLLETSISLMP